MYWQPNNQPLLILKMVHSVDRIEAPLPKEFQDFIDELDLETNQ